MQGFGSVIVDDNDVIASTAEVPVVSIDYLLRDHTGDIDLIKLDVQGAELAVIEGAQRSHDKIRNWIIGTHGADVHAACHATLSELGYSIGFSASRVDNQPDGLIVASRVPLPSENK